MESRAQSSLLGSGQSLYIFGSLSLLLFMGWNYYVSSHTHFSGFILLLAAQSVSQLVLYSVSMLYAGPDTPRLFTQYIALLWSTGLYSKCTEEACFGDHSIWSLSSRNLCLITVFVFRRWDRVWDKILRYRIILFIHFGYTFCGCSHVLGICNR